MNGFGIGLIVFGVILSLIDLIVLLFSDFQKGESKIAIPAIVLISMFAMACWFGVGFEYGVKSGAEKTAKGVFKTHYVTNEEGQVIDTIVYWY